MNHNRYNKNLGDAGEQRAADFLIEKGYKIIDRNWRTKDGEIDIIAEKDEIIVFVEVKTLPNCTYDMIQREINYQKQQRILKTTKRFLINHREYNNKFVRFDVIFIDLFKSEPVYHIESAFLE